MSSRVVAGLGIALGAAVAILNLGAGALACSTENSYCAGAPRLWLGRVYAPNAAPARSAMVLYVFASNQPRGTPLGREIAIRTDAEGRYCLQWPTEKVTAVVRAVDVVPGLRPDARLITIAQGTPGPIIVTPDVTGGTVAMLPAGSNRSGTVVSEPWDPATDATSQCVEHQPPWYRMDNLWSNWRVLLLFAFAATAAVMSLVGLFGRAPAARLYALAGASAGSAAAVLYVLIWITKTI